MLVKGAPGNADYLNRRYHTGMVEHIFVIAYGNVIIHPRFEFNVQ